MSEEEILLSKQDQLALTIAQGKSINEWARQNDVPKSTAYDWANDPECRRLVENRRRRCSPTLSLHLAGKRPRLSTACSGIRIPTPARAMCLPASAACIPAPDSGLRALVVWAAVSS